MYNSTYFEFKGKNSKDFNLQIVTFENTFEEKFGHSKSIQFEQNGNGKFLSYRPTIKVGETRELKLAFADEKDVTTKATIDVRNSVFEWLTYSKEFNLIFFDEQPDFGYYINIIDCKRWDNFDEKGYLTLTIMFMSDYIYSRPTIITKNCINTTNEFYIDVPTNIPDCYVYPYIEIEPRDTTIKINNVTTNISSEFINIVPTDLPIIKMHNDLEQIDAETNGTFNYSSFNYNFIKLKKGRNHFTVTGKCIIDIELSYPMAQ